MIAVRKSPDRELWLSAHAGEDVHRMDGATFEDLVAVALRAFGFDDVERTECYDKGGDLLAVRNGRRVSIQVKRWDGYIDQTAVMRAASGAAAYDCDDAMVITNSFFQPDARKLADIGGVTLWDQEDLANLLHVTGIAPRTKASPPACPTCGILMRYRRKRGTFWGCANFPSCRVTVMYHRWVLRVAAPAHARAAAMIIEPTPPPPPPAAAEALPPPLTDAPFLPRPTTDQALPPPPPPWSVIPFPPPRPALVPAAPAAVRAGRGAGRFITLVGLRSLRREHAGNPADTLVDVHEMSGAGKAEA